MSSWKPHKELGQRQIGIVFNAFIPTALANVGWLSGIRFPIPGVPNPLRLEGDLRGFRGMGAPSV